MKRITLTPFFLSVLLLFTQTSLALPNQGYVRKEIADARFGEGLHPEPKKSVCRSLF